MKPIQGTLYNVNGSSLYLYVRKVRFVSKDYSVAIIEFVTKNKWQVVHTMKNCKLYHERISHWEKVKQY